MTHPKPNGKTRLAGILQFIFVFSSGHRRFPCEKECQLICHSRSTENPTNALSQPDGWHRVSPVEMSCSHQCVKKGRGRETTRSGLPVLEAWRDGHANRAIRHLAASGFRFVGAPFLVENIVNMSRISVGGFRVCGLLVKNTPRGFALPIMGRMVLDDATVSCCCLRSVLCGGVKPKSLLSSVLFNAIRPTAPHALHRAPSF